MTEQTPSPGLDEPGSPAEEATRTGVPSVDAVLSEIEELDQLPLDQHLPAFERAHEALRASLDAPSDAYGEAPSDAHRADPAADEPA